MLCSLSKLDEANPLWCADLDVHDGLHIINDYMVSFEILPSNLNKINRREAAVSVRPNLYLAPLCPLLICGCLHVGGCVSATTGAKS